MDVAELAAWTTVASAILNLDETIPARVANPAVQTHRFPSGDGRRLGRRQVRFHGESRSRKVERLFPVAHEDRDAIL